MNQRISQIKPRPRDERDGFSALESEALALWQAPAPPPGFHDRLMARTRAERSPPLRGLAVAALAIVLIGGMFSVRALFGSNGSSSDFPLQPAGFAGQDGGPRPEVRAPFDGVESQPS